MSDSPTHADVRAAFQAMVDHHGLRPPDEVVDVPGAVLFLYAEPRVAVEVSLDDDLGAVGPPAVLAEAA